MPNMHFNYRTPWNMSIRTASRMTSQLSCPSQHFYHNWFNQFQKESLVFEENLQLCEECERYFKIFLMICGLSLNAIKSRWIPQMPANRSGY